MSDHKTPAPRTLSTSTHTNIILMGEAFTLPVKFETPQEVDAALEAAKIRFAKNGLWTISALGVERITPPVRARLRHAFDTFREAGGIKIIVICAKPFVALQFMGAAREAHNIELQVIERPDEYASIAEKFREKYHPKPKSPSK